MSFFPFLNLWIVLIGLGPLPQKKFARFTSTPVKKRVPQLNRFPGLLSPILDALCDRRPNLFVVPLVVGDHCWVVLANRASGNSVWHWLAAATVRGLAPGNFFVSSQAEINHVQLANSGNYKSYPNIASYQKSAASSQRESVHRQ